MTPAVDEATGLLIPDEGYVQIAELLEWNAALVVAAPWTGKTFVTTQLRAFLRDDPALPFEVFWHVVSFEEDEAFLVPSWWDQWRKSEGRACWVIDAIDEDLRKRGEGMSDVLRAVEMLEPDARARLTLIMLGRENEIPEKLKQRIAKTYGQPGDNSAYLFDVFRLTLLDAVDAEELVGGAEAFQRVCKLIADNQLQSIAGYPAVLGRLKSYDQNASIDDVDVWRDVLIELLKDKKADAAFENVVTSVDEQFDGAARIAAITALGNVPGIDNGAGTSRLPSIDAIIPRDHEQARTINRAARDSLRSTIFRRTHAGYLFAQLHVQQWLAAFGLQQLSLTRLRPLITDQNGKIIDRHRGILALLVKTTSHPEVRDWINSQFSGIPPRVDAAPWPLRQAVLVLDRLQEISKSAVWGLSLWDDRGLSNLAAPGLGRILANRFADDSLTWQERELVGDVALAVRAPETVKPAVKIAMDATEPGRIRNTAATIAIVLGRSADWLEILGPFEGRTPSTRDEISLKTAIIQKLFDEKLWTLARTFKEVPPPDSRTSFLYYRLEQAMTLDDAREILKQLDIHQFFEPLDAMSGSASHFRSHRAINVLSRAVNLVASQPSLSHIDFDLLLPIASDSDVVWRRLDVPYLVEAMCRDQRQRRDFFEHVIRKTPTGTHEIPMVLPLTLNDSDIDWLIDRTIARGPDHPWLYQYAMRMTLSHQVSDEEKARLRQKVQEAAPTVVGDFDDARARARQQELKWDEERKRREQQAEGETYVLKKVADEILANEQLSLKQRMLSLSWLCLCPSALRPTNVSGEWEDLSRAQQSRVLATCSQALQLTEPSPVPDGATYPSAIVHEAYTFARVLELLGDRFELTADLVNKWLPSCVAFLDDARERTLSRCFAAAPQETVEVVHEELARRLRSDSNSMALVDDLPVAFWDAKFAASIRQLIESGIGSATDRQRLLHALAVQAPASAQTVIQEWLASADENERFGAIDVLFRLQPDVALRAMQIEIARVGKRAFLGVHSLIARHESSSVDLGSWHAGLLADLLKDLYRYFPRDQDPRYEDGEMHFVDADDEYRRLRDSIPPLLMKRGTSEDRAALASVAAEIPSFRDWHEAMVARENAGTILSDIAGPDLDRSNTSTPFEKVAKAIDSAVYRVLRTASDLQAVLVEEILSIAKNARDHLALLHYPRRARRGGAATKQKTLQEDALQAYFHCRLTDRLVGRVLERETTVMFLNREPLTAKDQRLDIKVEAPSIQGTALTVVIELKWSRNPGISTSMHNQLVKEYLLGAGLTHGIYLVGWSSPGPWRDSVVRAPKNRSDLDTWLRAFEAQARAIAERYATVSVRPIVVDMNWPASPVALRASKRAPRGPAQKRKPKAKRDKRRR